MKTITLILMSCALLAEDKPTHIDFKQTLIGADRKPIIAPDTKKPVTLGDIAGAALMNTIDDDRTATGADKFKLFVLAQKILDNKGPFTVEDIALLKQRIGKAFGPSMVGPAWNALDPAMAQEKKP